MSVKNQERFLINTDYQIKKQPYLLNKNIVELVYNAGKLEGLLNHTNESLLEKVNESIRLLL